MTSVTRGNGQLFYEKYGNGPECLLAFHGFGQDGKVFEQWPKWLNSKYTIYAFDLFYHGRSHRVHDNLSKHEWQAWIDTFLLQERIERFSVLGYSLGGRFAISAAVLFEQRINRLILVAPDGIYLTTWFKLATTPGIRRLFKHIMTHPNRMERLLAFNDRTKIINSYIADFAKKEMGDLDNRKRIYWSWNFFKTLGYSEKQLIQHFSKVIYDRRLILGKKDHIIPSRSILPIIKKMGVFQLDLLPLKHHQLVKSEIAELLLNE